MAFFLRHRQTAAVKGNVSGAGIGNFQHDAGGPHHFTENVPFVIGQRQIGVDRIFQGIGQNDSQIYLIHRQGIRQGNFRFYRNALILSLIEIGGEYGIQHRRPAPPNFPVLVKALLGGIQKFQGFVTISPGHQFRCGLKPVAQIMALGADGIFRTAHRFHAALEGG